MFRNKALILLLLILIIFSNISLMSVSANKNSDLEKYFKDNETSNSVSSLGLDKYVQLGVITAEQKGAMENEIAIQTNLSEKDQGRMDAFGEKFDEFMEKWYTILKYVLIFGVISTFLVFIFIFMKLSFLPSHPIERRKAMIDIITSGVSTAMLGSLSIFFNIFYGTFSGLIETKAMLSGDWEAVFSIVLYEYRMFIVGVLGVATLTMVLMFIKSFLSLGTSAGNPTKRSAALLGVLLTGIATLGLGGLTFWVVFFLNALT